MTRTAFLVTCVLLAAAPAALAAPSTYAAKLDPTNSSGVGGAITFTLDITLLTANLVATGLVDGVNILHIHGLDSAPGVPVNTIPPPTPVPPNGDTNKDGVVNTQEAKAAVGLVLLSLAPHTPGTQAEFVGVTSTGGTLAYSVTFDLAQNVFKPGFTIAGLLPLNFRVFDMHGGIVLLTSNPMDGITGRPGRYDVNLPIAAGKILATSMPEPASFAALSLGLFGLGIIRRRA